MIWWGLGMGDLRILGVGWVAPEAHLPSCAPCWPARFRTRREAWEAAKALTAKFAYTRLGWRFYPVRLKVTILEESEDA